VLDPALIEFVTTALPEPPARVLEIGAGTGELAAHLTGAGYDVVAIDPASETPSVRRVALADLDEPAGSFDGAFAVVSLHHVTPLGDSAERLASLLRPGSPLVVDEFDVASVDADAMSWWLAQGPSHEHGQAPGEIVDGLRSHLHALDHVLAVLDRWFEFGDVERLPYLYRWDLDPSVRPREEDAIARGEIPATGAHVVGRRRAGA
jgi:SAM-dependent methyltransferase